MIDDLLFRALDAIFWIDEKVAAILHCSTRLIFPGDDDDR